MSDSWHISIIAGHVWHFNDSVFTLPQYWRDCCWPQAVFPESGQFPEVQKLQSIQFYLKTLLSTQCEHPHLYFTYITTYQKWYCNESISGVDRSKMRYNNIKIQLFERCWKCQTVFKTSVISHPLQAAMWMMLHITWNLLSFPCTSHTTHLVRGQRGGEVVAVQVTSCVDMGETNILSAFDRGAAMARGVTCPTDTPVAIAVFHCRHPCYRLLPATCLTHRC